MARVDYLKLGTFVLVGLGLLGAGILVFIGLGLFEDTEPYYLEPEGSVHGLDVGAPVELKGLRIGSVGAIALYPQPEPDGVRVTIEVRAGAPVYRDAKAYLEYQGVGVSGRRYVEIKGGSPEAGRLEPGSMVPVGDTLFDKLQSKLAEMADKGATLMSNTSTLVVSLNKLVNQVDAERVNALLDRADHTLSNLEDASELAKAMIAENRPGLRRVVKKADDTMVSAEATFERAEQSMQRVDDLIAELQSTVQANEHDVQATIDNLREASRNFEALGRRLRRDPSRLLLSDPPKPRELP